MAKTVKVPMLTRPVPVIYIGTILAILWATTCVSVILVSVFPTLGPSFWITLTGFALVPVIGAQASLTLAGNRAEARRRVSDRIQHYHELLKEHAYQEWVKASPVHMDVLAPGYAEKSKSLEHLYLARPTFESLTLTDPDHAFGRDAVSHMSSYPIIQADPASNSPLFAERFKPYLQNVNSLVDGLGRYCEGHNAEVLEFSNWEVDTIEGMAKECSLKLDRDDRDFALAAESISLMNLVRHLDRQSQKYSRKLETTARGETGVWDLLSTKPSPDEEETKDYDVAASESQDKLKQFKKLVTAFSRDRARRLRSLNDSIVAFEQAFNLTKENLQIIINAVDSGTFAGKCLTEDKLVQKD